MEGLDQDTRFLVHFKELGSIQAIHVAALKTKEILENIRKNKSPPTSRINPFQYQIEVETYIQLLIKRLNNKA